MRAMAAEAEAAREARAKVIAAEGEHKASRALKHAAEVMEQSPAAVQVTLKIYYNIHNIHSYLNEYKLLVSAPVSPNLEQYFSGKQQYYHISSPNRYYGSFCQ